MKIFIIANLELVLVYNKKDDSLNKESSFFTLKGNDNTLVQTTEEVVGGMSEVNFLCLRIL